MTTKTKESPYRVKFSIHPQRKGKMAYGRHSGWCYPSPEGDVFVSTCGITRTRRWPVHQIDDGFEVTCRKCLRIKH
jgi:hypothetical protein